MKAFAVCLAALCLLGLGPAGHEHHAIPDRYVRSVGDHVLPDVTLVDMDGQRVPLESALGDGPVLLQFIFTTCPTVCPILSSTLAGAQDRLPEARLVSISIDPEHDTPGRLRDYARRFRAGPRWSFLTGSLDDVVAVQKAFGVYRSDKMQHEPSTFLRAAPGPWVRLTGDAGADDLAAELRKLADPEQGKRVYLEACASCHRRSGYGASEGGAYVPPVTGPFLFERRPERTDLFRELYQEVQSKAYWARIRDPRPRPAYTEASLARAVREGFDPAGRKLSTLMPRTSLSDGDMAHLAAWLRTLSAAPSPGVDAEAIHFATVFTPDVAPEERRAILGVMEAFFQRKNADTDGLLRHAGGSPWYKDDLAKGFRRWVLHVWDLEGQDWRGQLETRMREQPVFALLSGAGNWGPVHDFCESEEVPCLFPSTRLPAGSGDYTIYFHRGLAGEAQALARHLEPSARIVQVYRDTEEGLALAEAFRKGFQGVEDPKATDLVLWLEEKDFVALAPELAGFRRIYLSASLVEPSPALPLREKLVFTYPYALPGREGPHAHRARAWLRSRGLERTHERLQLNTHYALSLAEHALDHMAGSFSRDFFVESVEREAEVELNPGVFPRLSLGPGQRFASKGCYIVRLGERGLEPLGDWIVTE